MTVDDMVRHRVALRQRQQVLRELDDELAQIHAKYQDELRQFYEKKSARLRNLAFEGVPAAIDIRRRRGANGR